MTKITLLPLHPYAPIPDLYVEGLNDPEVNRYLSPQLKPWSVERIQAYIRENWMDGRALLLGLYLDPEGEQLIGTIRLHQVDWITRSGTVGLCLFDKTQWRKGYGLQALRYTLLYGRERGLTTFKAGIHLDNLPSQLLFEKCGFRWGLWPSEKRTDDLGHRIYRLQTEREI